MSMTRQKPYKKRSNFATSFEHDVVSATVDVSVSQLRTSVAAQFPAAAGTPWDQFAGQCQPGRSRSGARQLTEPGELGVAARVKRVGARASRG